jgi:hypothetical protein
MSGGVRDHPLAPALSAGAAVGLVVGLMVGTDGLGAGSALSAGVFSAVVVMTLTLVVLWIVEVVAARRRR